MLMLTEWTLTILTHTTPTSPPTSTTLHHCENYLLRTRTTLNLLLNGASLIPSTPFDLQPQASTNCPLGSLDLHGAPLFSKPIAHLFNLCLATSVVPRQWKHAAIHPIQKTTSPKTLSDFRPISTTPVLTRIIERIITIDYIYPALLTPPPSF